jgi:hypothetical protein
LRRCTRYAHNTRRPGKAMTRTIDIPAHILADAAIGVMATAG